MEAAQPPTQPPGQPPAQQPGGSPPQAPIPERRYRALRTIATVLRVLAFIVAIVGGLAVLIGAIVTGSAEEGGFGAGLLTLVGGALYVAFIALILFAYAETIRLAIDIEGNTRQTVNALLSRRL